MVDLGKFALSSEKSELGVWAEYELGLYFRIARVGSPAYERRMMEVQRGNRKRLTRGSANDPIALRPFIAQVCSELVMRDWGTNANGQTDINGNVIEGAQPLEIDGKIIEWSPEAAFNILNDQRFVDIYLWTLQVGQTLDIYREDEIEDAGNG